MKQDWNELVRRSVRKDFAMANFKRMGHAPKIPHPNNTKRVIEINQNCEYFKFRKFFIGRLVRIVQECGLHGERGTWVEFVRESDRKKLNEAAGWSDNKREYLLHHAKFDD